MTLYVFFIDGKKNPKLPVNTNIKGVEWGSSVNQKYIGLLLKMA